VASSWFFILQLSNKSFINAQAMLPADDQQTTGSIAGALYHKL